MATVQEEIDAPTTVVYAALVDPRTYPRWLVGCREVASIDAAWPAAGSRFDHRVGLAGPLAISDHTESRVAEADHALELEVRFRPVGRGIVRFELTPSGDGTTLTMHEHPIGWLAAVAPVLEPLTHLRNKRSLQQLGDLCAAMPATRR